MSLFVKSFILNSSFRYTVNLYRYIRRTCQCKGASVCSIATIVHLFFSGSLQLFICSFFKFGWRSIELCGGLDAVILLTKIRCRLVGFRPVRKLIRAAGFV